MIRSDFLWKFAYLAVAGGVFLIDQSSKAWAVSRLRFGDPISLIPGLLNFAYAENTGVAFSMLDDHGSTGRWGLSVVALIAGFLLAYTAIRRSYLRSPSPSSCRYHRQCYGPSPPRLRRGFHRRSVRFVALSDLQRRRYVHRDRRGIANTGHVLVQAEAARGNATGREHARDVKVATECIQSYSRSATSL